MLLTNFLLSKKKLDTSSILYIWHLAFNLVLLACIFFAQLLFVLIYGNVINFSICAIHNHRRLTNERDHLLSAWRLYPCGSLQSFLDRLIIFSKCFFVFVFLKLAFALAARSNSVILFTLHVPPRHSSSLSASASSPCQHRVPSINWNGSLPLIILSSLRHLCSHSSSPRKKML